MTRASMLRRAGLAVGLAIVVNAGLAYVTERHDIVTVTLILLCSLALVEALTGSVAALTPVRWRTTWVVDSKPAPMEASLARYQRIFEIHRFAKQVDDDVQRRLLALARRKLAQARGLDPDVDGELELRRRLGPDFDVLVDPSPRRMSAERINRIIDRIEEL